MPSSRRIPPRSRLLGALLPALLLAAFGSCARNISPPGVFFSSDPPGARILVDGRDSGYVTPRMVAFDPDDSYHVTFDLPGFYGEEIVLLPHKTGYWIAWEEGIVNMYGLRFPLYLSMGELFIPRRVNTIQAPSRVFVRMQAQEDL